MAAMPPPLKDPAKLGYVRRRGGQCRAQFWTQEVDRAVSFEGPWHDDERLAQDDLETIRAAAHPSMARAVKLQAMLHQADFLKDDAKREDGGVHAKMDQ